jgi:hypothetical protein
MLFRSCLSSPRRVRGRVQTVISRRTSVILGRFRPGSVGEPFCYFHFGLKRRWEILGQVLTKNILMLRNSASGPESGLPGPDSSRESFEISPPAGFWPAGGPILRLSRFESDRNPAWKLDFRPESTIAKHRVTKTRSTDHCLIPSTTLISSMLGVSAAPAFRPVGHEAPLRPEG